MTEESKSDHEGEKTTQTKGRGRFEISICLALFIRIILWYSGFAKLFERRVEIENPVTSWFRVKECVMLSQLKITPYSGDICHQPPLMVLLYQNLPPAWTSYFFTLIDILTGLVLFKAAKSFTQYQIARQDGEKKLYAVGTEIILIKDIDNIPYIVASMYLLNPFTIVTCVAHSTTVVNNLVTALVILSMFKGWLCIACVLVAVVTHLSLYHVMLIVPVLLFVQKDSVKYTLTFLNVVKCLFWFSMATIVLLVGSSRVFDSWDFIDAVYGFVLKAPDLTPNMGLFWYFFLEMFDHFRLFFLVVYQINTFIYVIPLTIIFRKEPMVLCYALLSLIALFQSYSSIGHLSIPFAILPLWSYLFRYMRNVFLIAGMFFFTAILAPSMWYLWIYAGMGNANFFYAVTLAYNTAQVFLLSDVLYAFLRHQFHLTNGISPKTIDGKDGIVIMK